MLVKKIIQNWFASEEMEANGSKYRIWMFVYTYMNVRWHAKYGQTTCSNKISKNLLNHKAKVRYLMLKKSKVFTYKLKSFWVNYFCFWKIFCNQLFTSHASIKSDLSKTALQLTYRSLVVCFRYLTVLLKEDSTLKFTTTIQLLKWNWFCV